MSSVATDMVEGYKEIVDKIENFKLSDPGNLSAANKELKELVKEIKDDCRNNYNSGADDLGWNIDEI